MKQTLINDGTYLHLREDDTYLKFLPIFLQTLGKIPHILQLFFKITYCM